MDSKREIPTKKAYDVLIALQRGQEVNEATHLLLKASIECLYQKAVQSDEKDVIIEQLKKQIK